MAKIAKNDLFCNGSTDWSVLIGACLNKAGVWKAFS